MGNNTTLFSLVSKQAWPQILSSVHIKPEKLVLLHSSDEAESKIPAKRLEAFFRTGIIRPGNTRLFEIPHDDFQNLTARLDLLLRELSLNPLNCILNFTGGNKLMATASFDWALAKNIRTFYLERENKITWFEKTESGVMTREDRLDGHIADCFNPIDLIKCQLDASDIEREGEILSLKSQFKNCPAEEFKGALSETPDKVKQKYFEISGSADKDSKVGDTLEYVAAAILLRLGVKNVVRSMRLKVRRSWEPQVPKPHSEVDLVFTWGGKMWLVDCKDRIPSEWTVGSLRKELNSCGIKFSDRAKGLLDGIEKELAAKRISLLKEDIALIKEIGGLLGKIICVRRETMPDEVLEYAKLNNIQVVQKDQLFNSMKCIFSPDAPADIADLNNLKEAFSEK